MSADDRQRWNSNYAARRHAGSAESSFLHEAADLLPEQGSALDVAGGAGRHAIWMARRGLDVTLIDVSDIGLDLAQHRADDAGVSIRTQQLDLESEPLPDGPWDVILCFHYVQRELFEAFAAALAPEGLLLFCQPTVRNLERHPKPSRRFLLQEGEARGLAEAAGMTVVRLQEGWSDEDRHEARLIARGPGLRK